MSLRDKNPTDTISRFFTHVDKSSSCWEWNGRINRNGYGVFSLKAKKANAHRASWLLHNGPIPPGLLVCHKCNNKSCVNPAHLYLGTTLDNARDKMRVYAIDVDDSLLPSLPRPGKVGTEERKAYYRAKARRNKVRNRLRKELNNG